MTARPTLNLPDEHATATAAAEALADELGRGLDAADADTYDRSFADDVLWGNPRGGTLQGYARLNGIHHELMARRIAPPSRFEVVDVLAPAPDVAVAHIRRAALDGGFSEMALYVLVRRDGRWWLAAAQNTPVENTPVEPDVPGGSAS